KGFVDIFHILRKTRTPVPVHSELLERTLKLERGMRLEQLQELQQLQKTVERLEMEQKRLQNLRSEPDMIQVKRELQTTYWRMIELGALPELLEKTPDEESYVGLELSRGISENRNGGEIMSEKSKYGMSKIASTKHSTNSFEKYQFWTPKGKGMSCDWPQDGPKLNAYPVTAVQIN